MKSTKNPREEYRERKSKYADLLTSQLRLFNLLSNLRIITFFLGLTGTLFFAYMQRYQSMILTMVSGLILFLYLVVRHEQVRTFKERTTHLLEINEKGLERLDGRWTQFEDDGQEFVDPEHPFTTDFDIFGKASLFQWINTTHTHFGRQALVGGLRYPFKNAEKIHKRQEAIRELADQLDWRQAFEAEGMFAIRKRSNPDWLIKWTQEPARLISKPGAVFMLRLIPVLTVSAFILALSLPTFSYSVPLVLFLIQCGINYLWAKKLGRVFDSARYYKNGLKAYQGLVKLVEEGSFQADLLVEGQLRLIDEKGRLASRQIRQLARIVDQMDLRYNGFFYFLINNMVLWDFQVMIALERWKGRSGHSLFHWLDTVGQIESLTSFATIAFEQPEWGFPELVKGKYVFVAEKMGHPLLPAKSRVCNDLNLQGSGTIFIITGSNMSGKSTLLRTVGINLVLAYVGAPTCVQDLKCSLMELYSSMRVNDNLEKNISSFYAELLRVKMIVEASRKGVPMIFFIDEIFSGTNTRDRHIGAENVMKNLSKAGAMGLVSTHDLELGQLEQEQSLHIQNYHFSESYTKNRIQFDYRLKPGVSTTSNAIYLMKMVGIEVQEK